MHGVSARVLLRHLLAESGGSRTEAARRAGVGRSTLYRWIAAGFLDQPIETIQARYRPRPRVASKLEPYKPLLQARRARDSTKTAGADSTAAQSPRGEPDAVDKPGAAGPQTK